MADYGDSAKSYDLAREPLGCDIILEAFGNVRLATPRTGSHPTARTLRETAGRTRRNGTRNSAPRGPAVSRSARAVG